MLKKLLKYDIRYIYKTFFIVIIALFAVGLLTGALFGGLMNLAFHLNDLSEEAAVPASFGMIFLYFASVLGMVAIAALPTVCVLVLYYRFYRNLYTDQGYLSFTLPLKPTDHLHSKLIVSGTTMVILDVFVLLAYLLAVCLAILICQEAFRTLIEELGLEGFFSKDNLNYLLENSYFLKDAIPVILLTIVANLIMRFANICLVFFDITFACSIVKKHKLLASIGVYLVVNGVIGGIVYAVNMVTSIIGTVYLPSTLSLILPLAVSILLYIPIGIGSYFLNRHYINKKLNLQ